ncbi:XRE family transcriptional regulator, partial [Klebsiella pneumoniae]
GEGRRFAGDATHAYRNRGAQAAHFHSLIHYPKEKTASEPAARQDD